MGMNQPEVKISEAQQWVNAQYDFHYGKCSGLFHNIFYKRTHPVHSKQKSDGSSAMLNVCNKCGKIKNAVLTLTVRGFFNELNAK